MLRIVGLGLARVRHVGLKTRWNMDKVEYRQGGT